MRIAAAVLIVLASTTVADAQQLQQTPFFPKREVSKAPLFPTVPLDSRGLRLPAWSAAQRVVPQSMPPAPVAAPRSGPVCLKSVPVDASPDRAFALPVPSTRDLPMRTVEMPPCVARPQPPR